MAITMNSRMIAAVLQLVIACLSFSAAAYSGTYPGSSATFYEALNTEDKLWLYKRNHKIEGHECVFIKKVSVDRLLNYEFIQGYWDSGRPQIKNLKGEITMGVKSIRGKNYGATLKVPGVSEDGTDIEYLLVQWNSTYKCGTLYFETNGPDNIPVQTCELYIWEKGLNENVEPCLKQYDHYCTEYKSNEEQTVYSNKCQSLPGC